MKLLSVCLSHASSSKRCILKLSLQQNTNTKTPCWNSSPLISVAVNGVDCYGTGETCPRQYLDWGPQYLRSQLKSSCLYLLISWHFISPKRITLMLTKKLQLLGGTSSPKPHTRALPLDPAAVLPSPPAMSANHGDRSMPLVAVGQTEVTKTSFRLKTYVNNNSKTK